MKIGVFCRKIERVDDGARLILPPQDQQILFDELQKKQRRGYTVTIETPERDDGNMRGLFWSLIRLLALEILGECGADAEESIYQGIIEQYAPPLQHYKQHTGRKSWSRCDTKEKCKLIDGAISEVCNAGMNYKNAASVVNLIMEWKNWRYRQKEDPVIYETADQYRADVPYCEACIIKPGEHLAHIISRGRGADDFEPWNIFHFCQACHKETQHQKGWASLLKQSEHLREKVEKAIQRFKGGL